VLVRRVHTHKQKPLPIDIHFNCTMCGKCCHNLRLPLTISEAIQWLQRGHVVDILCDAVPWAVEPDSTNAMALHKRSNSFAARSGTLPVRIVAILTASHNGPCPNLRDDMRCGIYEDRPMVCRIYPAEVNPFMQMDINAKACPPEAWTPDKPVLSRSGQWVSDELRALMMRSRRETAADAQRKAVICSSLQINTAAFATEGFMIHRPRLDQLLDALQQSTIDRIDDGPLTEWTIVSNQSSTRDILTSVGALASPAHREPQDGAEYLGFN
jgi:Fe-S-cluster containining protein